VCGSVSDSSVAAIHEDFEWDEEVSPDDAGVVVRCDVDPILMCASEQLDFRLEAAQDSIDWCVVEVPDDGCGLLHWSSVEELVIDGLCDCDPIWRRAVTNSSTVSDDS